MSLFENILFNKRQIISLLETRPSERKHGDCDISILRLLAPNEHNAMMVISNSRIARHTVRGVDFEISGFRYTTKRSMRWPRRRFICRISGEEEGYECSLVFILTCALPRQPEHVLLLVHFLEIGQ
jgi:hypothetical protein